MMGTPPSALHGLRDGQQQLVGMQLPLMRRERLRLRAQQHGAACRLVAFRHLEQTGGSSVREWMLRLDHMGQARFYGQTTGCAPWPTAHTPAQIVISAGVLSRRVRYKGRCSGWLRCCDPRDPRPSDQCKKRHLKTARKLALEGLANAKSNGSQPLTLMEFHWPDSGLGWPHGALTFLDLVPMMRALPCRTVLVTVLRAPADLCTRPGCPRPRAMALLTSGCVLVGRHFASPRRMAHIGARRISADIPLRHMAHICTSWVQLDGLRL